MTGVTMNVSNPDYWDVRGLRAAVLSELAEFIPANFYANVRTSGDEASNDCYLSNRIVIKDRRAPQLTPRQLAAALLLHEIGGLAFAGEYVPEDEEVGIVDGITVEDIKVAALSSLQRAWSRYAVHLSEGEARALELQMIATDDKGRRDKQVAKIIECAKVFEYDLQSIPRRGKVRIKNKCLEDGSLFTDSAFDHAWKEASRRNCIRVENKESYSKGSK